MNCVVCDFPDPRPFDKVRSLEGTVADIVCCRNCGAIINLKAYETLEGEAIEAVQKTDFYMPGNEEIASAPSKVEESAALFEYLDGIVKPNPEAVFCDFGAGRGYVALYASRMFRKAIACEWDRRPIEAVTAGLPEVPSNFEIASDFDAISDKIGVLFMWHSLEHLPEPASFWKARKHMFDDDAIIFLQIPLFRPAHVVDCHYVFYTELSLTEWAKSLGAVPIRFGYDVDNGFLGMIAQRST